MPAFSGLFDATADIAGGGVSGHSLQTDTPSALKHIARILNKRSMAAFKERFDAAIDASTGEATVKTIRRVEAVANVNANEQGGVATIENENIMDSATITATEEAEILVAAQTTRVTSTQVEDSSGNGGGGKTVIGFDA
jgi:hypothetical protein|tara:strand:- start:291 stop:707 length:417 start_codon:yes stop_codon:yes gene_type:complete